MLTKGPGAVSNVHVYKPQTSYYSLYSPSLPVVDQLHGVDKVIRDLCLDCRLSWVKVIPRAALEKESSWMYFFAFALLCNLVTSDMSVIKF